MKIIRFMLLFLGMWALLDGNAFADVADPRAEDRQALLNVFHEIEAGINEQNIERMVAQMAPDVTVTWLNGETSRGPDQVRAYYQRMVTGPNHILNKYTTAAKLATHARFYGDVAVADGTMQDVFTPVARKPFELSSNWSSTSAKINGQWKVVALHLSSNVFNNTLLTEAKSTAKLTAAGGALGGLVLAGLACWWRRRT
ncbi:MAG: nuclear transport factor 2 family protein [Gammaproteobacteria bacterium]|nr:nuclear transport factor 2 family protein [Gammaproteobacteria bacterium]